MTGQRTTARVPVDCRQFATGALPLSIPVTLGAANIGSLEPLTAGRLDDSTLMERLAIWREAAGQAFFTRFIPTPERTRRWIRDQVLTDPARLLFTISDSQGPVGTIGFIGLTPRSVELDNLVRGERRGPPAMMRAAEAALLAWLFETFDLEQVDAAVLAGNFSAMQLHQSLGFEVARRVPLLRTESGGEVAFVETGAPADSPISKLLLVLRRKEFTP